MSSTPQWGDRSESRLRFAPWLFAGVLLLLAAASAAVVVDAVRGIASAFLFLPTQGGEEWVRNIIDLSSRQRAFGIATGALALAALGSLIVAAAGTAVRRGARAAGSWLIAPAILGAVLVATGLRLAQAPSPEPSFDSVGFGALITSEARGITSLGVTLGSAGVLVLAMVAGCLATASRVVHAGCVLVAVALCGATAVAVVRAAAPIDEQRRAPSYPAQILALDPSAAAWAQIFALGAAAFVIAALVAGVVRARRRR